MRALALIPAHNEAACLAAVVGELRAIRAGLDILIVDDGSTDGTPGILEGLDVHSLRFAKRVGIGAAVRAGLRYASQHRYDVVVRLDGDGQHSAADVDALLAPIESGRADVVLGSRYLEPAVERMGCVQAVKRLLAMSLSAAIGDRVTDPTSGFYALGPDAIRVLAQHHPSGYPEAELRLFLSRSSLRVIEAAVRERPRLFGRTSLTPALVVATGARVAFAMVTLPLRDRVRISPDT